jgi:hypothetical protein
VFLIGRSFRSVPLISIVVVYVILGVAYNVLQPIGEAPDEPAHVEFIRYIQQHHALPKGQPGAPAHLDPLARGIEFDQVPLYYLFLAGILSPIWLPPGAELHRNPFIGWPKHPDRLANDFHWLDEGWPYHGMALFVHLGRAVSIVFGLLTLLATYRLVATATRRVGDALFAMAWLSWTPGFLLASSRINNDAPAMAWSTLTLMCCVAFLATPSSATPLSILGLSVLLAAALLSKVHTVFLIPLVLVSVVVATPPNRSVGATIRRRLGSVLLVLALPLGLLGVWWLGYGHTFAGRLNVAVGFGIARFGEAIQGAIWSRLPAALWFLNGTWWGGIGASVATPWSPALYAGLAIPVVVLSGAGLYALVAGSDRIFGWVAVGVARPRMCAQGEGRCSAGYRSIVLRWTSMTPARRMCILLCLTTVPLFYATISRQVYPWVDLDSNARFILPVSSILALVVTLGGRQLPLGRLRRPFALAYLLGLLCLSVATAFVLLPRISDPVIPARLARDPSEVASPGKASFTNGVNLLAVDGLPPALGPSNTIQATLRWRVEHPIDRNYIAFVHVVGDADGKSVASGHDEIPFEKVFPPVLWQTGEIVEEHQSITLPKELAPGRYALEVGMYYLDQDVVKPIPIGSTSSTKPPKGAVEVASWLVLPDSSGIADAQHVTVRFGDDLALQGFTFRREQSVLRVTCFWAALRQIGRRLVVSVQILDGQGRLVAQHDGEPVGGRLPTILWPVGTIIRDDHVIPIASGSQAFKVIVVVYDRETLQRLPVINPGQAPSDHVVVEE